jgi:hypothetical protein
MCTKLKAKYLLCLTLAFNLAFVLIPTIESAEQKQENKENKIIIKHILKYFNFDFHDTNRMSVLFLQDQLAIEGRKQKIMTKYKEEIKKEQGITLEECALKAYLETLENPIEKKIIQNINTKILSNKTIFCENNCSRYDNKKELVESLESNLLDFFSSPLSLSEKEAEDFKKLPIIQNTSEYEILKKASIGFTAKVKIQNSLYVIKVITANKANIEPFLKNKSQSYDKYISDIAKDMLEEIDPQKEIENIKYCQEIYNGFNNVKVVGLPDEKELNSSFKGDN